MAASNMKQSTHRLGPALEFLQRLWALNHALEMLSNSMAVRLGVTAQQRLVIRCLGKYPGLSAGQLASLLHLDPGTISAALRRLETRKLVARKRDPDDHRRVFLSLTKKGCALDRGAPGTVENAVEHLLAGAKHRDIRTTVHILEQLTVQLRKELAK
jgi:DNA-binding MarR family transcriptional regulator